MHPKNFKIVNEKKKTALMCLAQASLARYKSATCYRITGETTGIQVTFSFFWEMFHKLLQSASINIVRLTSKK